MITDLADFKTINEHYPHIGNRLRDVWGTDGFAKLVNDLTSSHTGGDGFPQDIKLCMKSLLAHHEIEFKPQEDTLAPAITQPVLQVASGPADNEHVKVVNEQYPRIGAQLIEKWGTAAFPVFLNELMNDSRGGKRAGFSDTAATALFRLMMQHDHLFPQFELKVNDIWSLHDDGTQGEKH